MSATAHSEPALSLGPDLLPELRRAGEAGFSCVEVLARSSRPESEYEALADSGLRVVSAILQPQGPLHEPAIEVRRALLGELDRQLADAALLGAVCACLDAPAPETGRDAWAEALAWLAERAARRMLRLAVTAEAGAVRAIGVDNLGLWSDGEQGLVEGLLAVRLRTVEAAELFLRAGVLVSLRAQSPQTSSSTSSLT